MARFVTNTRKQRILKARSKTPKDSDFATMRALSDKLEVKVRVSYAEGVDSFRKTVSASSLEGAVSKAMRSGKPEIAADAVPWDELPKHLGGTYTALVTVGNASADATVKALPQDIRSDVTMGMSNRSIKAFVEQRTAERIKTIKDGGREVIRQQVATAMQNRVTPNKVATQIRDSIGLNAVQGGAVDRLRAQMESKGDMPQAAIDKRIKDATNDYLDQRAETIAHTEMRTAQNYAQLAVWKQAQDDGYLPDGTTKVWVVDGFPCDICVPMDGVEVGIDEQWELPDGRMVDLPSDSHPRCYCGQSLKMPGTSTVDVSGGDEDDS